MRICRARLQSSGVRRLSEATDSESKRCSASLCTQLVDHGQGLLRAYHAHYKTGAKMGVFKGRASLYIESAISTPAPLLPGTPSLPYFFSATLITFQHIL